MGLAKEGYKAAIHGTTTFKTPVDEQGNIINDEEDVPAGMKTIRFTRANAENSANDNYELINALVSMTGATTEALTNTFDVKWTV